MKLKAYISPSLSIVSGISGMISIYNFVIEIIAKGSQISFSSIITSTWFIISIIMIIIFIGFTHSWKKNKQLENEIKEAMIRIKQLEQANKIPIFKNKFSLAFTHKKDELSRFINNNVAISLMEIANTTFGIKKNNRKDSKVVMRISGNILKDSYYFKFMIAGERYVAKEKLGIKAIDIHNNKKELPIDIEDYGSNGEVKEFIISYGRQKKEGDVFCIEVSWVWPDMLDLDNDFITLPNFYASEVKKIKLSLTPDNSQNFNKVSIYEYNILMESPSFIVDVCKDEINNSFSFELENPHSNTDYIMYYKNN